MIEYRPFHNTDPPQLAELWHQCRLGRGAAEDFSADALEEFVFAPLYFDRNGFIVAYESQKIVGFVHAGFGCNEEQSALSHESGVICGVMVHPAYRRRGIGRELVARAEAYVRAAGAREIYAGPAEPRDPFYFGLYGGSQPSGFLDSDVDAAPFFLSLGYEPVERHLVYQREIGQGTSDPVNVRLITHRRRMELMIVPHPPNPTWWWAARVGRLDSLRFLLVPKGAGGPPVAGITAVGLDLYLPKWKERSVGLMDLFVVESERRNGYGQALLVEVGRRMREELVTRLEMHVSEKNEAGVALLEATKFSHVDAGTVFRRPLD